MNPAHTNTLDRCEPPSITLINEYPGDGITDDVGDGTGISVSSAVRAECIESVAQ
jgi:hypothetical protein